MRDKKERKKEVNTPNAKLFVGMHLLFIIKPPPPQEAKKYFHKTLKIPPWIALVPIRVFKPLVNPAIPSSSRMSFAISQGLLESPTP